MVCIGIDLGTTNSVAAYLKDGVPTLIPNACGETLTPSAVSLNDDGEILTGQAALDRLITYPDRSAAGFKRLMGTGATLKLGRKSFRPEELSAFILRSLKQDAEACLGQPVTQAVISVPAYFAEPQRRATLTAARLAGLDALRLVNEPTAAALAYGLENREEGHFLVLDLGGGTFDVSLLHKFEGIMEIRASSGDSQLGGNDFRDLIASLFLDDVKLKPETLSTQDYNRLLKNAESIKRTLTTAPIASETFALNGKPFDWTLTRERFEESATPLITRLRAPIARVISDSATPADEIDEIIMVGGASRMPLMRALVTRLFQRFPQIHAQPDHLIGLGAAVQAGLTQRNAALDDIMMTDVCPFTLGAACRDRISGELIMDPIIERNTIIPTSRTKYYTPASDNQSEIVFPILQGENIRPDLNVQLGEVRVHLPPKTLRRDPAKVRFTYDISGALEVEITLESTGHVTRQIFSGQSGLSPEEIEKRFHALEDIKLAPRDQAANQTLIARAERIFAESIGQTRENIHQNLSAFIAAINDPTVRDHTETRQNFSAVLDNFERLPSL